MERVLSTEERIRRAEEVYRNKNNIKTENISKKTTKKKRILLRKMIIQIVACLSIYTLFYFFSHSEDLFSKDMMNSAKGIMSYDINFNDLYNKFINWLQSIKVFDKEEKNEIENTLSNEIMENITNDIVQEEVSNTSIGGAIPEEDNTNLSQMEVDAKEIKSKYNLTKPLTGTITSRFGYREPTTKTVPKNHTGIDIAANTGTVIYAALDGVVKIASGEGDYGNHLRIEKDDVAIYYAHCNKLYVKEGDYVTQNQPIAEVGATGNVTGPHLHFEIRKSDRYVNPDMILNF